MIDPLWYLVMGTGGGIVCGYYIGKLVGYLRGIDFMHQESLKGGLYGKVSSKRID